jgi:hypothetical protein
MPMHELKANDFILTPWEALESFPRDGVVVEVKDINGNVYRAVWRGDHIAVDADAVVELTHWRLL